MSVLKQTKINQLLGSIPSGIVLQSLWLRENNYSLSLQKRYRDSHWLELIGKGAMIRYGDKVSYEGAIYSLQKQTFSSIHPGGKTALSLLGKAHYLEISVKKVTVFGGSEENLPVWFQQHDWGFEVGYHQSSFLPIDVGLVDFDIRDFSIKISGAARAIMECLYLSPEQQNLLECYELMEGLNNLHPKQVQQLLEKCHSIKVKRLFLYLADKAGHKWLHYVDLTNVDLGKGKRSIVKNGVYIPKYEITVPKDVVEYGKRDL